MDIPQFVIDFHATAERQGPGSPEATLRALDVVRASAEAAPGSASSPDFPRRILDLGAGTGAQTLTLAKATRAKITAVDILPGFLAELGTRAAKAHVGNRVAPLEASMNDLDLPARSYDLIWSESAIYTIGFEFGLKYWEQFLREGGFVVVSELCWLGYERPAEVEDFWNEAYPDITTIPGSVTRAENAGYEVLEHFVLPSEAWWDNYYGPIRERSEAFRTAHAGEEGIDEFIDSGLDEADLYEEFGEHYGYVYFVLRPAAKTGAAPAPGGKAKAHGKPAKGEAKKSARLSVEAGTEVFELSDHLDD